MASTREEEAEVDCIFSEMVEQQGTVNSGMMKSCFDVFDQDRDGMLDIKEFTSLTRALFCNENGKPYIMPSEQIEEIFDIFDKNKDEKIDYIEFKSCWDEWIKQILSPISALIVVDIQNDFISGTLALKNCAAAQDAAEVVPVTNHLLETVPFDFVAYSIDWHPENHISFYENLHTRKLHESSQKTAEEAQLLDTVVFEGPPLTEQTLWPAHCIQESWGSQLHEDLKVVPGSIFIHKGANPEIDSYSAFWDNMKLSETNLLKELLDRKITDVYVCGVAHDVCVGSTANDALSYGFRTILIKDACRGVAEEGIEKVNNNIVNNHGVITTSDKVKAMVLAKDRLPELGYQAALKLKSKNKTI